MHVEIRKKRQIKEQWGDQEQKENEEARKRKLMLKADIQKYAADAAKLGGGAVRAGQGVPGACTESAACADVRLAAEVSTAVALRRSMLLST